MYNFSKFLNLNLIYTDMKGLLTPKSMIKSKAWINSPQKIDLNVFINKIFPKSVRVAVHCKFLSSGTDSRLQLATCGQRMQSNAKSGECQIQCGVWCYQGIKCWATSDFWTNTDWTRFFLIQLNFSVQVPPSRREYLFAFPSLQMMLERRLEALWILESCFDFSLSHQGPVLGGQAAKAEQEECDCVCIKPETWS